MPFLGKQPTAGFASIVKDDLTPDGSTTAFTLSKNVASANDIAVFVGNVRQEPTDAYTVNGTTLTMTAAPSSGVNFYVLHIAGTVESSVVPADDTISTAKLQDDSVTTAKIGTSQVTDAKIASGITSSKVYPNKIRVSDLDVATQGVGLMMWEHIETKHFVSDGDSNHTFSAATGYKHINFDVTGVKHLYPEYKIVVHYAGLPGTDNARDLLIDTLQNDGQTVTGAGTWYGGGARMSNNSLTAANGRNGNTSGKLISNVWPYGMTSNNWNGGTSGEVYCKGFLPEVTQNIDGVAVNGYYGGQYRSYYESKFHTYDDTNGIYIGDIAMVRQNKTFDSDASSGVDTFGGFSLFWNLAGVDFVKGTTISIYGLRLPSGT